MVMTSNQLVTSAGQDPAGRGGRMRGEVDSESLTEGALVWAKITGCVLQRAGVCCVGVRPYRGYARRACRECLQFAFLHVSLNAPICGLARMDHQ